MKLPREYGEKNGEIAKGRRKRVEQKVFPVNGIAKVRKMGRQASPRQSYHPDVCRCQGHDDIYSYYIAAHASKLISIGVLRQLASSCPPTADCSFFGIRNLSQLPDIVYGPRPRP